jgi:phosphate:Na+ symporter
MEIVSAIIQLLGGLAMFLYGIEVMGDGLKNSSGDTLKRVLEKVTGNMFMGVLTGTMVTAVIQSSTATIVLTVALIGAGVLTLKQAVSIVMGANIGTTVTSWIIQLGAIDAGDNWFLWLFDTDTLAPIALAIGIVLIMFVKGHKTKTIGDICIGFGILFVGLMNMTGAVKGFADSPAFMELLASFSDKPLLGILAGLVLTVIVQSSSATVAMLQSLSATGAMDFSGVYPIIMGINIGTCIVTAFYCFVGGSARDSKRTGVVHVAFNSIGTVVFMIIMSLMQHFNIFGSQFWSMTVTSTIIALFQTAFNLFTAIMLIPFTDMLVKLSVELQNGKRSRLLQTKQI